MRLNPKAHKLAYNFNVVFQDRKSQTLKSPGGDTVIMTWSGADIMLEDILLVIPGVDSTTPSSEGARNRR